ncbi:hypothetical protein I6B53_04095 [Schaalia sp. 19OD2882]|uniref:DUF6541 family protein n=1 Tax=Schaalia sp. 19OD2882 TaxID=2794089 RepID=UPI001C1EBDE9|nr:DUF6541 family protein [Schaalia sp. 19OD2882]QWW20281.1 hypothetical protein I6B53_04095 [Schaalia sp. 19OD2882]
MNSTWLDVLAGMVLAGTVLFVPGALIGWAAALRARTLLMAAPLLSATVVALSSVCAPLVGLSWGIVPLALVTAALAGLAALARLRERTSETPWDGDPRIAVAVTVAAAAVHLVRLTRAYRFPFALSQTYDSPFHVNLVQRFVARGDASWLHVSLTTHGTDSGFYPATWHAVAALVSQWLGVPATVSINAMTFAVTGFLWPALVVLVTASLTRSWTFGAVAGALAFALPQMPNQFTYFGVLYPNLLGYVLVVGVLGILVRLFFQEDATRAETMTTLGVGILALPGLAVTHPSALFTAVILSLPLVLVGTWSALVPVQRRGRWWIRPVIGTLMVVGAYVAVERMTMAVPALAGMRSVESVWASEGAVHQAVARVLSFTTGWMINQSGVLPWLIGAVALVGAMWCLRDLRTAWLPLSHTVAAFFYVVAFSWQEPWRGWIVGLWYADTRRFEAMVGLTGVFLLALGAWVLAKSAVTWVAPRLPDAMPRRMVALVAPTLVLLLALLAQVSAPMRASYSKIGSNSDFDTTESWNAGLLSMDEYRLLERLPQHVPAASQVIGNPWNGSVFASGIGGVDFAFPHVAPVYNPDAMYLAEHLRDAATDPKVCQIVRDEHIDYVLDFGTDYLWHGDTWGKHLRFPALKGIAWSGLVEEIDREGHARLLRISACD